MLIIRRRQAESLVIDGHIEIQVVELTANRVKLGITAPPGVVILRKEIQLAAEQNRAATQTISREAIQQVLARYRSTQEGL